MREGSLEAPTRHPLAWQDPDFYDPLKLEAETRRVFDICHGCRRCFNLCDSFPRLFDLIDQSESGELDRVRSADFGQVVDACTLCDMCFMTKCPYVPPHPFNLDFPHLMLRHRAVAARAGRIRRAERELAKTDRNGRLAGLAAPLANWASATTNKLTRPVLEKMAGLDRRAALPKFTGTTFAMRARETVPPVDEQAPAYGRKAVLYATCFVNYSAPEVGMATRAVLAKNGVETEVVYPRCCGMPLLEQGAIDKVAANAKAVAAELKAWIAKGYDVVALVPSCALMLKFEWPLILPGDKDVKLLSTSTYDVSEYVVDIAKREGLADGLQPIEGGVAVHLACHARAQNMGQKAAEMLRLIPATEVQVIERCSGHGGSWGCKKEFFEVALKVGRPVARQAVQSGKAYLSSECPLAGMHIAQGMERLESEGARPQLVTHPIELLARAYGLGS
ncbi:MAG TPA: heterodisulfide reductase-related iron-sulfur binding cluster [Alphaproteobacteria bacterium]|nr:heterodisulfide reductase-related iron-sulfur binding cluster [Alphaproteobacteria bacterium]